MRDCNSAGSHVTVVLIHSSRLFTEGLASLLKNTHYDIHQFSAFDGSRFSADSLEGKVIFIVGGRTSSEIVAIVKSIRSRLHTAYILVINAPTAPNDVLAALEAGADGYLRDAISPQTFIRVIELVVEDETILPPEFVRSLREHRETDRNGYHDPDHSADGPENAASVKLSAREGAILRGLVDGEPNKVIAQRLQITEATVKVHVKAILRKIRVKNRTQAAIWGAKHLASLGTAINGQGSSPSIQI